MTVSFKTWLGSWRQIVSYKYIKDRANLSFIWSVLKLTNFEKKHPNYPWITIDMINVLENLIKKSDVGFEFGGGYSTIWFANNSKRIVSVEHNKAWYEKVMGMIKEYGIKNVKLNFVKNVDDVKMTGESNYVAPIDKIKNNSLDYCFVDGIFRDECILKSIDKLKSGALLIVDNVDSYFPKNKISISVRYKRDNFSKSVSRAKMKMIYKILSKWKCIWTTSAIQDTALWIKP